MCTHHITINLGGFNVSNMKWKESYRQSCSTSSSFIVLFFLCLPRRYFHCFFFFFSLLIFTNLEKKTGEFWFAILISANWSQNYYFYLLFVFFNFAILIKSFFICNLEFYDSSNFRIPIHNLDFIIFFYGFFCPIIEIGRIKSLSCRNNAHYRRYT